MKISKLTLALLSVVVISMLVSAGMLYEISSQDMKLRDEIQNINLTKEELRGELIQMQASMEYLNQTQQAQNNYLAEIMKHLESTRTTTTTKPAASTTTTTIKPTTTQQTTTTTASSTTKKPTTTSTRRTTTTTRVTSAS